MSLRPVVAASIVTLLAVACASQEISPGTDGTWVGTIATEGDVTTVVNESGSVWGGTATLVEEASIGVDVGPEEYMLGEIASLHATEDEIYLVDTSVSMIRVYDFDGNHLRSFGGAGQGPGEIGRMTHDVTVGEDGRVYLNDFGNRRINIYSQAGEAIDEIPLQSPASCCRVPLVFAGDGGMWVEVMVSDSETRTSRVGILVYTAEGPVGETIFVPEIEYDQRFIRFRGRQMEGVPFAARVVWTLSYDQAMVVGASDRYAFRMLRPGGETTVVERFWDPVPVGAEEADWWRRFTIAGYGQADDFNWNGENIPDHKPAYRVFFPSASGEIWVIREGRGDPEGCDIEPDPMAASEDPERLIKCLVPNPITDVFGRNGRYLGEVEGLALTQITQPFIYGDGALTVEQDEAGVLMVKRYRLLLPGEQ